MEKSGGLYEDWLNVGELYEDGLYDDELYEDELYEWRLIAFFVSAISSRNPSSSSCDCFRKVIWSIK